jgi:hypothetical protein
MLSAVAGTSGASAWRAARLRHGSPPLDEVDGSIAAALSQVNRDDRQVRGDGMKDLFRRDLDVATAHGGKVQAQRAIARNGPALACHANPGDRLPADFSALYLP